MSILIMLGLSLIMLLSTYNKKANNNKYSLKAHYLAEAGIEKVIVDYLLKDKNKDWTDNQFLEIYKNEKLGEGNFSVSLQKGNKKSIIISATGTVNGISQNIKTLIAVDWQKQPPKILSLQWQEQKDDSLNLIY